jgi:hypothetical protein
MHMEHKTGRSLRPKPLGFFWSANDCEPLPHAYTKKEHKEVQPLDHHPIALKEKKERQVI